MGLHLDALLQICAEQHVPSRSTSLLAIMHRRRACDYAECGSLHPMDEQPCENSPFLFQARPPPELATDSVWLDCSQSCSLR